jgi:7-cyano-7-deazaguanine synthase
VRDGYEVVLLHFQYGCKAETRETERIAKIAEALGCEWKVLPLPYGEMAHDSPLTRGGDDIAPPVEGAEYAHEWVPARNFVMLALAVAFAESHGYHYVALGNNLEESGAYPDNEEEFTHLLDQAVDYAVRDGYQVRILAPAGNLMKHEIVARGVAMNAPFEYTWSCYRGGDTHCGECGPCFMRKTAFDRNDLEDPVFS